MFRRTVFTFLFLLTFSNLIWANGLTVSATSAAIIDEDSTEQTATIVVDNVSWQNAWKDSTNSDAVWLFFKYTLNAGVTWRTATMKTAGTNPTGFSTGSQSDQIAVDLIVPEDKMGVFVVPKTFNSGTVQQSNLKVVWDWGKDIHYEYGPGSIPASLYDNAGMDYANLKIRVFAIEMVYVPEGGFYLGDGATSGGQIGEYGGGSTLYPRAIGSEAPLNFLGGATMGSLVYRTDVSGGDDDTNSTVFNVGEEFPKGFHAFYLMKYEITEGQYVGFLNTLSRLQQNIRVSSDVTGDAHTAIYVMSATSAVTNRSTINRPASGNGTSPTKITFASTYPDRAANYLRWMDLAAYADWAGLRPMTEVEYEKTARGPIYPVNSEYIYGTTVTPTECANISSGTEDGSTTCTTSAANVIYKQVTFAGGSTGLGPARAGMLAKSDTVTRITSGAGYYGNMDLAGNVWEWVVTLGNAGGRSFAGTHGDGNLTTLSGYEGNATNLDWPGIDATTSRGVSKESTTLGSGRRGGSWNSSVAAHTQISSRYYAGDTDTSAVSDYGGRCARTAPD